MRRNLAVAGLLGVMLVLAMLSTAATQAADQVAMPAASSLVNGLAAYWRFDEASGTRIDFSGHDNGLAEHDSVASAPGHLGSAAAFTRNYAEYLSHTDNADLSQGNNDFTVAGWFYLHAKPTQVWGQDTASFYTKWGSSERREYGLLYRSMDVGAPHYVTADTFEFVVSSDGTELGTKRAVSLSLGGVLTDTWYFIVAWHDSVSNTINIQVNNGPIDSTPYSGGVFDSTSDFEVGRMQSNNYGGLDGRVDELGIWDRVLTAEERTALYNSGTGLTYPFDGSSPADTPTATNTGTATKTATPTATPKRVYSPIIHGKPLPRWVTIKQDGFEGAFPNDWQVADLDDGDGHYYWGARDCRAASGSRSAWAVGGGDGAGLGCGSVYPNNTYAWMVYGPFSLADASAAEMTLQINVYAEPGYDFVCYLASATDDQYYGSCSSGNSGGWLARTLNLASVPTIGSLLGDDSVWVAMVFASDGIYNYPNGGFVDDILIRKCIYGICPPSTIQSLPAADGALFEEPAVMTRP